MMPKRSRLRKSGAGSAKCRLKKVEWLTPNKMKFESSHKTFNKQTTLITTGNALGATQLSSYIRPFNEPKNPFGKKVAKGAMQEFDLNYIKDAPARVKDAVRNYAKTKNVILYEFRHYVGDRKIVDGYVITTGHEDGNKHIKTFYINQDLKAMDAVDEASKYVACRSWS